MNGNRVRTIWNCEKDPWVDKWKHQSAEDFAPDQWYKHAGCATAIRKLETWSGPSTVQPSISSCRNKVFRIWETQYYCKLLIIRWVILKRNLPKSRLTLEGASVVLKKCTPSRWIPMVHALLQPQIYNVASGKWTHVSCFKLMKIPQSRDKIQTRIRDKAWRSVRYSESLAHQGVSYPVLSRRTRKPFRGCVLDLGSWITYRFTLRFLFISVSLKEYKTD